MAIAQGDLAQVRSERDQQAAQFPKEMVVVRTEAECRLDAAQQALLEAQASAASTVKQVEMLASQLVAAERKVNQVEQEKAAWIDKILTQRKEKKGSNKLGSQ